MYLVTQLLNSIWDCLIITNNLNISDAEWMSGQAFGSYYSYFLLALNVCICACVWIRCLSLVLGYLWPWETWQSLWELTAVTSKEQQDGSLQRASHLFCLIKYLCINWLSSKLRFIYYSFKLSSGDTCL